MSVGQNYLPVGPGAPPRPGADGGGWRRRGSAPGVLRALLSVTGGSWLGGPLAASAPAQGLEGLMLPGGGEGRWCQHQLLPSLGRAGRARGGVAVPAAAARPRSHPVSTDGSGLSPSSAPGFASFGFFPSLEPPASPFKSPEEGGWAGTLAAEQLVPSWALGFARRGARGAAARCGPGE